MPQLIIWTCRDRIRLSKNTPFQLRISLVGLFYKLIYFSFLTVKIKLGLYLTSVSVKDWSMSPHGIAGLPDQSSPNSRNKCWLVRPLSLPNDVREKSYNFFTPFGILASRRDSWVKVHQSSPWCAASPLSINLSNFVPFWQPVYETSAAKFHRFRWRRDRQQTVNVSAYHAVNEWWMLVFCSASLELFLDKIRYPLNWTRPSLFFRSK